MPYQITVEVKMRVGFGFDVHPLKEGRKLILGGVEIDYSKGLDGHSDADVVLHAIMDAILGATASGDIGHWFPPDDPAYKGVNSLELLERVVDISGARIINVDCVIVCEEPKIAPYVSRMKECIATALRVAPSAVSVKATTTEKLGFIGREEGIAAYAVVLVEEG